MYIFWYDVLIIPSKSIHIFTQDIYRCPILGCINRNLLDFRMTRTSVDTRFDTRFDIIYLLC